MSFHSVPSPTFCVCVEHSGFIETAYGPQRLDQVDARDLLHSLDHGLIQPQSVYSFRLTNLRSLFSPKLLPCVVQKSAIAPDNPLQNTAMLSMQEIEVDAGTLMAAEIGDGIRRIGADVTYTLMQFETAYRVIINGTVITATAYPVDVLTQIGLLERQASQSDATLLCGW